jgi:DNA-directed RNA polymerase specialized sigma24 family protein
LAKSSLVDSFILNSNPVYPNAFLCPSALSARPFVTSSIAGQTSKVSDAEDIALSAFHNVCRGVENKRFPAISDRYGLWRLLVSITIYKLLHVVRDEKRLKRGGGRYQELNGFDSSSDSIAAVNQIVSGEPVPEFAVEFAEQYEQTMLSLGDEELVPLAILKMEYYSNEEIAKKVNRATRTVERKLQLIRKIWIHRVVNHD